MQNDTRAQVRAFIRGQLGGIELADDDRIFDTGYVKSMFVAATAAWAERVLAVSLSGSDLDIRHFQTIGTIDALIAGKLADRPGLAAA